MARNDPSARHASSNLFPDHYSNLTHQHQPNFSLEPVQDITLLQMHASMKPLSPTTLAAHQDQSLKYVS
jgi:alanyl-tRNA synthetase